MELPAEAWKLKAGEVLAQLGSSEAGLGAEEARRRLGEFGKNEIERKRAGFLGILVSQFVSPLVLVLLAAAVVSYFLDERTSAVVIVALVGLNGLLGFAQEYKSQKAAEKLEKMVAFTCKAVREGMVRELPTAELVPGDVVRIEAGDRVPADLRLIEADGLLIDEAVLTGESYPAKKNADALGKAAGPHEMRNIAFMGAMVSNGQGTGVAVATGEKTFFGKTAALLEGGEGKSAFERNIEDFSGLLVKIIAVSLVFIFIINAFLGKGIFESLLFAVALAVGLIPEALPIIITLSLSNGSLALSRQGVIVKRLSAIEDLGNVDVLCTDKTGTLTESRLEVRDYFDGEWKKDARIIEYAAMCTSITQYKGRVSGNPIDVAIANRMQAPGHRRVKLIPFDYERRRMSTVVEYGGQRLLICKGSPEAIIAASKARNKKRLVDRYHELGEQGYRAIAVGFRRIGEKREYGKEDERDLEFLGFVSFLDPPKKAAKDSLDLAKRLGLTIKLITGDNLTIAKNIARQTGFEFGDGQAIIGEDLDRLARSPAKLREAVDRCVIFARVSPVQKHLIIKTLKANGHVVAFLGDGVNDAPSLKEADVGISVNNGADVTKEAADIILMRKSMNSVVQGISGGRKVFSNIIKYIVNTMAGNFGDLYTIAAASAFLRFIPLKPVQIILANFVSDAPMISVSTDNVDDEELLKPKKWNVAEVAKFGALLGLVSMVMDLILMIFLINETQEIFQTGFYIEIILSEIVVIMSLRSSRPFFRAELPSRLLIATTVVSLAAGLGLIYTPLGELFGFVQLPLDKLLLVVGIVCIYLAATEMVKLVYVRTFKKELVHDERALAALRSRIAPELH